MAQMFQNNFPYTYYKWVQDPTSQVIEKDTKQIIKFLFKSEQYVDPATAYLQIQIRVDKADYLVANGKYEGLALDGPSTALIDNLKIYCNNRLVEHIDNYSSIGQIISDYNIRAESRENRGEFGLGSNKINYKQNAPGKSGGYGLSRFLSTEATGITGLITGFSGFGSILQYVPYLVKHDADIKTPIAFADGFRAHSVPYQFATLTYGSNAQKQLAHLLGGTQPSFKVNAVYSDRILSGEYGMTSPKNPFFNISMQTEYGYLLTEATQFPANYSTGRQKASYKEAGNLVNYSRHFDNPNQDVVIMPGHKTQFIKNGMITSIPDVSDVYTFKIPIISSFIGVMATGFTGLLDGNLLGALGFEFRLNPYAFYVTGPKLNDEHAADLGVEQQFERKYSILSAQMIFDTYHRAYTPQQALGPTEFWANAWTLPIQQQFTNTKLLTAEHQINIGVKSARLMIVRFLLDDYNQYSFCRRQFKISANVTSYQVKMGSLLFPVNPLQGHAGTPYQSTENNLTDNQEFVDYFNRCMGTFMQPNKYSVMDRMSFALSDRVYELKSPNPNNLNTNHTEKLDGGTFFWEQKMSKAVYLTRFDDLDGYFTRHIQNNQDYDYGWNGIDTTTLRPFTLSIKTDQINFVDRPVTMQVAIYQDVYVRLTPSGVYIEGAYLQ